MPIKHILTTCPELIDQGGCRLRARRCLNILAIVEVKRSSAVAVHVPRVDFGIILRTIRRWHESEACVPRAYARAFVSHLSDEA